MRVLVFSQYFWPENFRVNDVARELAARGHSVTVLTSHPNYPDGEIFHEFKADRKRFSNFHGIEVIRIWQRPRKRGTVNLLFNYLSFIASGLIFAPLRLRGKEFDAIFMFEISPITSAIPALLLRRLKRAPLLMWVLDLWPETLSAVGIVKSPRVLRWVGRLVSFIYKRCDRILIQSRAFEANVQTYSTRPDKIRYFPAWAEIDVRADQNASLAPEVAPYRGRFNIMFAGNIGEAQDFPAIINAVEACRDQPEIRWLILGSGRAQPELDAQISARGLENHIFLLGRYPVDRMASFFMGADALLVSLRDDPIFATTIPGKVQTYLASDLPLLGMLNGEGARVIEEAGAGFCCAAGDGIALATLARRMAALPRPDRIAMGRRGRVYCEREFDRAKLIAALEGWLAEAAMEV